MEVEIKTVNSKSLLKKFIEFPIDLYKNEEHYIAQLYLSEEWMLSDENPFFRDSDIELYLAYKSGRVAGRIAAIYNREHLKVYDDSTAFFGFFDSVDDDAVVSTLFNSAEKYLKSKGIKRIVGPTNLNTNDSMGVLSKGFDKDPFISIPYNFEYYNSLLKNNGFSKVIGMKAYLMSSELCSTAYEEVYKRSLEKIKNNGITIRSVSKKTFDSDMEGFRKVYNECNRNNWGFMPLNKEYFKAMADDLKKITPLEMVLLAEKDKEIIAFLLAVPDFNQVLKKVKNGKLFPFGIFKILWHKPKINRARLNITGTLDKYQDRGLHLIMSKKINEIFIKRKIVEVEASYILESNKKMNSILLKMGGELEKEYIMYAKNIAN